MNLIDRLKELEANATPGPWKVDGCGDIYTPNPVKYPRLISISDEEDGSIGTTSYWSEGNPNAALIAEMRNVLPKLLAVVEAAKHAWEFREDHDHNGYQIRGRDLDPLGQAIDALEQEP